jgi:hypothetical protein
MFRGYMPDAMWQAIAYFRRRLAAENDCSCCSAGEVTR